MIPSFLQTVSPLPLLTPEFMDGDIARIHALSAKHGLFPLVYSRLRNIRNSVPDSRAIDNYLAEKETLYLKNVSRSAKQEASSQRVLAAMKGAGIPALVIRGYEIARDLYGDANLRTSSDIDILIKLSDAVRADSFLSKAGYYRDDRLPLQFWLHRLHHAVYTDPQTSDLIEMHWGFTIPSLFSISSEEIWQAVINAGSGQLRLSPEMNVIMLLAHHHMHAFRELKILVDLLWALQKYEQIIPWEKFIVQIAKTGLIKSTMISLSQIQTLWKEQSPRSVLKLQSEIEKMGYRTPRALLRYFAINPDKQYPFQNCRDKIMARIALDSSTKIVSSFVKSLFPVAQAIKALYGDQRSWTLPLNYTKFILWRMKDWTGIGKNAKTPV